MPAPAAASTFPAVGGTAAGFVAGLGLLLLTGPALPLAWGVLPAVVVGALALGLGRWRAAGLVDVAALVGQEPWRRRVLAALVVLPVIIVVASAVRLIAGVCVAFPAASAALVVLTLLGALVRGRAIAALAMVVGGLAIAAAIGATRIEANAPGGRGFAHSGAILGIHPFQTTAIVIDGYGPFDLPINDYVEPDGSRGYGPAALAEALQRDLAAIAEQQFADGPARAYQAFAGATVEAVELPSQQERLDRPVEAPTEPRLVVRSGTTGWRSRVEFVCPGTRNDPRARQPDAVLERMCPDKYSSEASAGLGVTGRWTGYTEGRGVAWPNLGRLVGGSRNDPVDGALVLRWELRGWAWIALVLLVPAALWPSVARGVSRGAAVIAAAALAVLLVMVVGTWPSVQVPALAAASPWNSPWSLQAWAPALVLVLAASLGRGVAAGAAALVGATGWGLAGALAAGLWLNAGPGIAGEALVGGLAGGLQRGVGIELGAAEAIAASVVVASVVGLLAGVLGPVLRFVGSLVRPDRPDSGRWIGLVVIVAAASLVVSRKTVGGAALLTPALALGLAAITAMALCGASRGRGRVLRVLDHGLAVVLVVVAAVEAWTGHPNAFVVNLLRLGVIAAVGSLGLVVGPRSVRSAPASPHDASQG